VNQRKSTLAALLFSIVIVAPAVAEQAPFTPQSRTSGICSGCFAYLEFPPLPELVEAQTEARPAGGVEIVSWPSGVEHNELPAPPQTTWRENPSLMDLSWRRWPSLTDF
jgi:hypothetical protein